MDGWIHGYTDAAGPREARSAGEASLAPRDPGSQRANRNAPSLPPGPRASESVCQAEIAKLAMCRKLVAKGCSGSGQQRSRASVQRVCEREEAGRGAAGLVLVSGKR